MHSLFYIMNFNFFDWKTYKIILIINNYFYKNEIFIKIVLQMK